MRLMISLCLLSASMALRAQDCKLTREDDAFTKEKKLSTGFVFVQGGSFTIDADKREIIILFNVEGPERCFDNNSTVAITFEGLKGKNLVRNAGTMNCEGLFQLVFRNGPSTPSLLQKLTTQKLDKLVFTGSNKKEMVMEVDPAQRAAITQLAACLAEEARKLLQP